MKKIFVIAISFLFLIPFVGLGQGKVTRPKKTEPVKKEHPKETTKSPKTLSQSQPILPNSTENINGITVHWNEVTQSQKTIITNLLNSMVDVPSGSFMMGSDDSDAYENEKPIHREIVSSFRLAKYEVTQKLWKTIMGNNPSNFKGENLPVEYVSWKDCQLFILKLNEKTGLRFRLPSESEWEYAAKEGNISGKLTLKKTTWYRENSGNITHIVGTKLPNELGLYDMEGNVREWTSDCGRDNVIDSCESIHFAIKGGSFSDNEWGCRASRRSLGFRGGRDKSVGFRLALSI